MGDKEVRDGCRKVMKYACTVDNPIKCRHASLLGGHCVFFKEGSRCLSHEARRYADMRETLQDEGR